MAALANIARIYPETREANLQSMERIIPIVLAPEMRLDCDYIDRSNVALDMALL